MRTKYSTPRSCKAYPWKSWFTRLPIHLRRGLDYDCRSDSMRQLARFAAKREGISIKVEVLNDAQSILIEKAA